MALYNKAWGEGVRKSSAKKKKRSSSVKKNNWIKKQAYQFANGVYVIEFENNSINPKYLRRSFKIDTRKKVVKAYYEGRRNARLLKTVPLTAGFRKMVVQSRGKFYK